MADKIYKLIFTKDDGTEEVVQFTAPQGPQGIQGIPGTAGADGKDGYTPVKGVDYMGKEEAEAYIATELAKRGQLKPEPAQTLEAMTDTTKMYVLLDKESPNFGYIFAWMYTEKVTDGYINKAEPLPNNTTDTTKWVNGYRFSSSGISAEYSSQPSTITNDIECTNGDKIYIKGVTFRGEDRYQVTRTASDGVNINVGYYNTNLTLGGYTVLTFDGVSDDGIYQYSIGTEGNFTVHSIRFAIPTPADASQVIITVNDDIEEPTIVKEYAWTNTGKAIWSADTENRIDGLTVELESEKAKSAKTAQKVEALEGKIENIGTTEIPDYWQPHIDEKISTIKNLHRQYGKDCFSFVLFADTHYPSNLGKISPVLAKRLMDEVDIKYAIHVGDWQTRGCLTTREALLAENEAIETMFAPIRDRLLMEQGNHDGSYGWLDRDGDGTYNNSGKAPKDRETYVHNLTPQELHEFAYRKVGTIGDVHFDETGTAYYIDDTSNNVRYIGLNTQQNNYELQADGTQLYPKMWIMRFTQPQFDFLTKEALVEGVKEKTKIVIFAHVPTTQELGDKDVMNGVLRAFVNKTTYSGSYAGEYGYDAVSVNVDFTDAKGTFVGYFHGHTHIDSVNTSNGFNIIGTRCDAKEENTDALKNERVEGTVTEQSFDVFTVTPTKIYATKIGAGTDREITY